MKKTIKTITGATLLVAMSTFIFAGVVKDKEIQEPTQSVQKIDPPVVD